MKSSPNDSITSVIKGRKAKRWAVYPRLWSSLLILDVYDCSLVDLPWLTWRDLLKNFRSPYLTKLKVEWSWCIRVINSSKSVITWNWVDTQTKPTCDKDCSNRDQSDSLGNISQSRNSKLDMILKVDRQKFMSFQLMSVSYFIRASCFIWC